MMVFDRVQEGVGRISDSWLFADQNPTVRNRKCLHLVVYVSNKFVVNVVEWLIVHILIIIPKVLEPSFIIGKDLPSGFPILRIGSPLVIFVPQNQIKLILLFTVLSNKLSILIVDHCPVKFSHQWLVIMMFLVNPVPEGIFPFLVQVFDDLLESDECQTSSKLWNRQFWGQKLRIMRKLQFTQGFALCREFGHHVTVKAWILQ